MSRFHLSQFLPATPPLDAQFASLPEFPESVRALIVCGPEKCGKTSMLFRYACSLASAGLSVVYLCQRSRIEDAPPALPPGIGPDHPILQNIAMRYLETLQDVQKFAACFHLIAPPPAALVIDGLTDFLAASRLDDRRSKETELTKTLAFLSEALGSGGEGGGCRMVVSDVSGEQGPPLMYILQRWLPTMLMIRGNGQPSGADSTLAGGAMSLRLVQPPAAGRICGPLADLTFDYAIGNDSCSWLDMHY